MPRKVKGHWRSEMSLWKWRLFFQSENRPKAAM